MSKDYKSQEENRTMHENTLSTGGDKRTLVTKALEVEHILNEPRQKTKTKSHLFDSRKFQKFEKQIKTEVQN